MKTFKEFLSEGIKGGVKRMGRFYKGMAKDTVDVFAGKQRKSLKNVNQHTYNAMIKNFQEEMKEATVKYKQKIAKAKTRGDTEQVKKYQIKLKKKLASINLKIKKHQAYQKKLNS